jgi:hypothetical protein
MPHWKRMRQAVAIFVMTCLAIPASSGQIRSRRATRDSTIAAPAYKGLIVSVRGVIKKVSKKELLLESGEKQLMTIRCSKKTRFWRGSEEIKPTDVDLESPVTIDATEDSDLKLMAVNVHVDPAPKKTLAK